jgi:hypothetical protein
MPTVDIPDKICPHCGGTKWFLVYQKYKDKVYTIYNCRTKRDESNKKWNSENREARNLIHKRSKDKVKHTEDYIKKNRKRASVYYQNNPDKVKTNSKNARLKNPDKYNQYVKLAKKRYVKDLSDIYIKELICYKTEISRKNIPQELIEIKRKQLLLKRKLKQCQS